MTPPPLCRRPLPPTTPTPPHHRVEASAAKAEEQADRLAAFLGFYDPTGDTIANMAVSDHVNGIPTPFIPPAGQTLGAMDAWRYLTDSDSARLAHGVSTLQVPCRQPLAMADSMRGLAFGVDRVAKCLEQLLDPQALEVIKCLDAEAHARSRGGVSPLPPLPAARRHPAHRTGALSRDQGGRSVEG